MQGNRCTVLLIKTAILWGDVIGLEGETIDGTPLLIPVMKEGKICYDLPTIREIQGAATDNLARLPEPFKHLKDAKTYPVIKSKGLEAKRQEVEKLSRTINVT